MIQKPRFLSCAGISLCIIMMTMFFAIQNSEIQNSEASEVTATSHLKSNIKSNSFNPCVALTFDDGPNPYVTPKILAILQAHHLHATFFVVGEMAKRYSYLVKQEVQDGDMIGNHSWKHAWLNKMTKKQRLEDLDKTQALIETLAPHQTIKWLRPPYGAHNAQMDKQVLDKGWDMVWWNVDDEAYRGYPPSKLSQLVLSETHPGSIVLMHDIQPRTAEALNGELTTLQKRGIRFCLLPQWQAEHPWWVSMKNEGSWAEESAQEKQTRYPLFIATANHAVNNASKKNNPIKRLTP